MFKRSSTYKEVFCLVLGTGCLLAYVLLSTMSSMPYGEFQLAFDSIMELAATGDMGCALACVVLFATTCAQACGAEPQDAESLGVGSHDAGSVDDERAGAAGFKGLVSLAVASAIGLCLSTFLRAGCFAPESSGGLLVGDFCSALFLTFLFFVWWQVYALLDEGLFLLRLAQSLLLALVLFVLLALVPTWLALPAMALALPLGACLPCVLLLRRAAPAVSRESLSFPQGSRASQGFEGQPDRRILGMVFSTVAISALFAGLVLNIIPLALNTETSFNSLSVPALIAAVLLALFVFYLVYLSKRGSFSLSALYIVGFLLLAFGYLTFPFLPTEGVPLSLMAVGQFVVVVFIALLLLRFMNGCAQGWGTARTFVFGATALCAGELLADVVAICVMLSPSYAYEEFQTRAVITFIAIAVLILLSLLLLPKVDLALAQFDPEPTSEPRSLESSSRADAGAELASEPWLQGADALADMAPDFETQPSTAESRSQPSLTLEELCADFSSAYGLSHRESEVLFLLASGRDVPYIEKKLTLAKSTVKTHVKHIYEKCEVSSRQDLLDLLEDFSGKEGGEGLRADGDKES